MNKHCYRLIFSRTHGELRVVSELARSCSSEPGQTRATGAPRLWVTVRRVIWMLGLTLCAGTATAGGIVADGQAGAQRPQVIATQNGLPQVNITAPNQAGVSHNQYRQFDVDKKGAILNNSASMTSTQLAGMIQGNPNLNPKSAPARVILNEVNSNNPSELRGFLEVAGGRAQVIVANPAGIVCNGCGTINAGRMTLTTGKPQLNADGSLAGYQVERGTVRIEGGGLNGDARHDTEYVDVLARAVDINAGVWARQGLNVVAGRNRISADGKTVTALATDGKAPELAIDMGQMGGMYSGQIRMIGTEAGVGVRNQGGHIQAAKTLTVSSEGKLTWQSGSQDAVTQAGGDIRLAARDALEHHGKLHGGGTVSVESREGEIKQSGTLAAAGDVALRAKRGISSSGHLLAGSDADSTLTREADLTLTSQGTLRASGSLLSKKDVKISGKRVDLSQSTLAARRASIDAGAEGVALQQARVDAGELAVSTAGDITARQAQVGAGRWDIEAASLSAQGGVWSQTAGGESRFALTGQLDNTGGSMEARQLALTAGSLANTDGRLVALDNTAQRWEVQGLLDNRSGALGSNGNLTLSAGTLNNQDGTLQSQSALQVRAETDINNAGGRLLAGDAMTLDAAGRIDNVSGRIDSTQLALSAEQFNNTGGELVSQQDLTLSARQSLNNQQGLIEAGRVLSVQTGGEWDNQAGNARGGSGVQATAGSLNNTAGRLQSGGVLTLNSEGVVNNQSGKLTAADALSWQGADGLFSNDGGQLIADGALSLHGGQLTNRQQGTIQSQQSLTLDLTGEFDNQDGALTATGPAQIRAGNLLNGRGSVQSLDSLDMQLTRALDNSSGRIFSQRTQTLSAGDIFNTGGWMGTQGSWSATGGQFVNRDGSVQSQQDASLRATTLNNRQGTLISGADLTLNVSQDTDNRAGKISALGQLALQGQTAGAAAGILNNGAGQLLAGKGLTVAAQAIHNGEDGAISAARQLQLDVKNALDNRQGHLESGSGMTLAAGSLHNQSGSVSSLQQLAVNLNAGLDNTGGAVRSNGDQTITADQINNRQGVFSSGGGLMLTARQLDNQDGTVIGQGAGEYRVDTLNNQQGRIHSGDALTLETQTVNNQAGQLVATRALDLHATQLDNSGQGSVTSQDALRVQTDSLNNRDGGLLLGTTLTQVTARTLDNRGGRLSGAGAMTLTLLETLDNRQGHILANQALKIQSGNPQARSVLAPALNLLNQSGEIRSGDVLTVQARSLNNQGGTLLSQRGMDLTVQQDYTHRAGDTLSSNGDMTLSVSGVLTNLTDWLLPGSLTLNSQHFTNQGSLVGKTLQLTTGKLLNQGRLEADSMTLNVDTLDNAATLIGDEIKVRGGVIDNHGRAAVMAATQRLDLHAGASLLNRDGSLLYSSGNLLLGSDDLIENRASSIEADGDIQVDARRLNNLREGLEITRNAESSNYKWHRYNYYWRSYGEDVNTDKSTVASTTQRLTFQNDAAAQTNRYGTLLAIDAGAKRAQVRVKNNVGQLTDMWIHYLALKPASDGSYDLTFYETRGWNQNVVPTPYQHTFRREHDIGQLVQWDPERYLDIDNAPYVSDYSNLRERTATGTVTTDKLVSAGTGAQILAGGNMILHVAGELLNDASTLSANGDLNVSGAQNIVNKGYSVNERRQEHLVDHYDRAESHWYPTFDHDETTALSTVDAIMTGNGSVTIQGTRIENVTVNQAQIGSVAAAGKAAEAGRAEQQRNPLAVTVEDGTLQPVGTQLAPGTRPLTPGELALTDKQHLDRVATTIPNNGLFRQNPAAGSPYLVVTDERFTSRSKFISSDYLLDRVGYDPARVIKRLGDGFYEQRLVREQVLALTGRPSVKGDDAMTQYQNLMNNGSTVAQDFKLVPGVALTPAQIAALQQDIVWLVSETVDSADGPQTVWVPKVYLANTTLQLSGDGALMAGGQLQLSAGSLSNAGNLVADRTLDIDASRFQHQGGDIRADSIHVQAASLTLSTNLQDALRQASMTAGDISLSGTDVKLQGAKLDASRNLSLSAQNSLEIGTARSSHTASVDVISGSMGNRTGAGMEEAGARMAQVSGEWQQAQGSTLNAGGNLSLSAGQDITLQGSQAKAGGNTRIEAGGDVKLLADKTTNTTHLTANSRTSSVSNTRQEDRLLLSTLSGDQGVALVAGKNLRMEGAQVDSQQGQVGVSAQDVTIKEARQVVVDQDSENKRGGKTKSHREELTERDSGVGSTLSGKNGVTVIARDNDIALAGSTLHSEEGAIALQAKRDVLLNSATDRESQFREEHSQKKGLLSKSSSHTVQDDRSTLEQGSLLSGDSVSITAGRDLAVVGSAIAADRDVALAAGHNVDIIAATETDTHYRLEEKKKSGLMSSGGIGFTVGKQSSKHEVDEKGTTQSQSVSTVGSSQGNVSITAGNQLHIGGADLVATRDLNLTGDSVAIDPGYDQRTRKETFEQKQSGLSVALSGSVGSALNAAVSTAQQARKEGDGRLNALQNTKAALSGVQAAQAWARDDALTGAADAKNAAAGLQSGDKGAAQGATNTVGVTASWGSQSSKSETRTDSHQSQGSTLSAGQNLSITATGKNNAAQSGDIAISGSQLKAGKDLTLDAARDITLHSAQNSESTTGTNSSKGGNVGVGIGAGTGGYGISVSAGVNAGKGHENGNGLTHSETTLDAGSHLSLTSGRDTTLQGAQASGEKITVDAGRNLTLASERDSDRYDAKQQNVSAGGSFTFGSMTGSASVSASRDKLHSNFDSVKEQTGLFAGKGGYDVTVKEHTQLDGAVIASTAESDRNRLDTGTLGWSDIHNQADFKATHSGGSLSTGGPVGKDLLTNMAGGMLSGANNGGHAEGTTKAGVSEGTLTVRDTDKQQQDITQLNRDTDNANAGSISPIFDREKEQNRLKQAQLTGEIGGQAMDVIRTQGDIAGLKAQTDPAALAQAREQLAKDGKPAGSAAVMQRAYDNAMRQYGTGSDLQKAAQAVTGALTALAGNNLAGALASGASPYLATEIRKLTTNPLTGKVDVASNAMAHAVLGAVTAQLNNQSAVAGGLGAGGGELAARYIAGQLFPGRAADQLSESEKQQVSALSELAAGLAGGLSTGDTGGAVTAGQAGKNAVENNYLSEKESRQLDKELSACKSTGGDCKSVVEKYIEISNKNSKELAEACTGGGVVCVSWEEMVQAETNVALDADKHQIRLSEKLKDPDAAALVKYLNGTDLKFLKDNITTGDRVMDVVMTPTSWPVAIMGGKAIITNSAGVKEQLIAAGVSSAANTAIQYGTSKTGEVKLSDVIGSGVIGLITAGKGYNPTVTWNAAGGYYTAEIKGDDPFMGALLSKAGASVGYTAGNIIKIPMDKKLNPISKQYEWVPTGVWTITKPAPQNNLPSLSGNIADSAASGGFSDALQNSIKNKDNNNVNK